MFSASGYVFPLVARAGESGQWLITLRTDEKLPDGGKIRISLHKRSDWKMPQIKRPGNKEYWAARLLNGEELPAKIPDLPAGTGPCIEFEVTRELFEGDVIQIEIGGLTGATPQTFSQRRLTFHIQIARASDDAFEPIREMPTLRVMGSDATRLKILAPSRVHIGEEFEVLIRAEDSFGNRASRYDGTVRLDDQREMVFTRENEGIRQLSALRLESAGVRRIKGADRNNGLECLSNPVLCERDADLSHIYWGVLHGHTVLSDGLCRAEEYFAYARDESRLDFCACADHDHSLDDDGWEMARAVVDSFNDNRRFVTLLGYEWGRAQRNGEGDKCVYFRDDCTAIYRSGEGQYDTAGKLFSAVGESDVLVVPVHTASVVNHYDWDGYDDRRERLVEIYSVWGSSERSAREGNRRPLTPPREETAKRRWWHRVTGEMASGFIQKALKMGCRVGFTAGGGDHTGHPGSQGAFSNLPTRYSAGLTAVCAPELTRENIWDTLWNRRCYATTGARIIVDFKVEECPMGGELTVDDSLSAKRRIWCRAIGESVISKIELVRNGGDAYVHEGRSDDECLEWEDKAPFEEIALKSHFRPEQQFVFYYARVLQDDGEMAWSSPVWVTENMNLRR